MIHQEYDAIRVHREAESLYEGLAQRPLPSSFWNRSMLTRPKVPFP
jgi:hypothetical protein